MGNLLQRLVPEARVVIGHGQMAEDALERAMLDFMAHKFDVLLATTIVENGLDIPNANTIIINRADRYGLSQLYQLRGRVGRSDRPAYAYLLIPPEESLSPVARKRLAAIRGVQRSRQRFPRRGARPRDPRRRQPARRRAERAHRRRRLRDVHEAARGDDPRAEGRGSGRRRPRDRESEGRLPSRREVHARHEPAADDLSAHRGARSEDEIARAWTKCAIATAPPPTAVLNLADYARIRVLADRLGVETIDREGSAVVFKFREKSQGRSREADGAGPGARRPAARPARLAQARLWKPRSRSPAPEGESARRGEQTPSGAEAGLVDGSRYRRRSHPRVLQGGNPQAAPEDPRAPGGILDKVTDLLLALLDEQ